MLRMRCQQWRRGRLNCFHNDSVTEESHWGDTGTIALGLEGRSLGRMESVCIITLSTYSAVYTIDVVILGAEALRVGSPLKRVLELREIMKLMFDVRSDCDALFFTLLYAFAGRVRLEGLLVLSALLDVVATPWHERRFSHLGTLHDEDTGRLLFNPCCGGSFDQWRSVPLEDILVQYCGVDVTY
ncbi:LOW QUALITY PROTEIN: hypothetical protein Q4I29_006605, partial [Leishmania shawi]